MHKSHCYIIEAKSNLHAGQEGEGITDTDKEVQRENISTLPIINGTAVKGFIKEFVANKLRMNAHENDENPGQKLLRTIFGSDTSSNYGLANASKNIQKGQILFGDAKLLSLPVRAMQNYFYRATSDVLLGEFVANINISRIEYEHKEAIGTFLENLNEENFSHPIIFQKNKQIEIDADEAIAKYPDWIDDNVCDNANKALTSLIGERIVVLPHALFERVSEDLPVIDRNVLENGQSVNLWFEEVVPRESKFYFVLCEPDKKITYNKEVNDAFIKFQKHLKERKEIVYIGGSITVGYGRCFVYPLIEEENRDETREV